MIELLKSLGYTTGAVVALLIIGYLFREIIAKIIGSIFERDIEDLRRQNSLALEEVRSRYDLELENRKNELAKEVERLRSTLSVQAETYRLAAQNRFTALLLLWEASEALFAGTDFSNRDSIRKSLTKVEDALAGLDRYSVLMKHETFEHIQTYLKGLLTVLTNSEQNFQEEKIQHEKLITDTVSSAASAFSGFAIGAITAAILPVIVEASKGILEGIRRQKAMQARRELQRALRVEFGILSDDLAGVGQPEPKALAGTPPVV